MEVFLCLKNVKIDGRSRLISISLTLFQTKNYVRSVIINKTCADQVIQHQTSYRLSDKNAEWIPFMTIALSLRLLILAE